MGRTLISPWTVTDLQARLDGDKTRAYMWIALWKRKGWIRTIGFEAYKTEDVFGG